MLVNNAGIMRLATVAEADDQLVDNQIAINLKGGINTLREVWAEACGALRRCSAAAR